MEEDLLFYKNEYCGQLSDDDFKKFYKRTLLLLKSFIFYQDVPGEMKDQFKMALCEMIDYTARAEANSGDLTARNVKSESVDGYSIDYGETETINPKLLRTAAKNIAKKYLTCPTNLLVRVVF